RPNWTATDTTEGTENQWVIRSRAANLAAFSRSGLAGATSAAPDPQLANRSNTLRSKVRSNIWLTRLPGPSAYRGITCPRNAETLRWPTGTPLGVPVEPEVNRM